MEDLPDILASRLNFDVIVFRGNTRQEMIMVGFISLLVTAFILGGLSKLLLGLWLVGIGVSFPTSVGVGWVLATIMQKFKAGKPKGYIKQRLWVFIEDKGLAKSPYFRYSGKWSVKRSWLINKNKRG